jgi:two-component system LytT family response regulator
VRIRTLIVDDEPLARGRIRDLLAGEADVEVVGECRDGAEAVRALRELRPELVFLDVQMPEMDGFEALAEVAHEPLPLVIFVTAYDQFAIKAFEVHALDYLLKPFDAARFARALARAREHLSQRKLEELEAHRQRLSRFVVRSGGRISFVKAREVDCIEATGNYMRLHVGKESFLVRETMAELEAKLDPARFVRVHRSWIVNLDRVVELQSWFHGGYLALLPGDRRIPVSRRFRDRLDALLGGPT